MDTLAPFGLRPAYHPSGQVRARQYPGGLASGAAFDLFRGTPVLLNTDGTIGLATLTNDFLGAFAGAEYTDADGRRHYSDRWPNGQIATDIVVWVWDDPLTVFDIQADGTVDLVDVGAQADFSGTAGFLIASGNTTTQQSTTALSATPEAAGAQGQLRMIGLAPYPGNAFGDAFTIVQVQIAQHQYVANKVGL